MNPLTSNLKGKMSDTTRASNDDVFRKETLGQIPVPMEKEEHYLDPWFFKCDDKIVKYDMRELGRWKVSYYTLLRSRGTYLTLLYIYDLLYLGYCKLLVYSSIRSRYLEPSYISHSGLWYNHVCSNHH